jgi:hypothetical protein
MSDSLVFSGPPKLRILNTDLSSTLKTWTLPFVDREGGVVTTDVFAKAIKQTLLSGGVRFIPGGIRHNVALNWALYDAAYTAKAFGLTVGTADTNVPQLTDLLDALATYNVGRLSICPGATNGVYWRVCCTSDMDRAAIVPGFYGNVSLTLEGLDVYGYSSSTTVIG